jgi:hypothetical protein
MPRIYQWAIGADRGAWRSRRQPVSVLLRNRLVVSGEVLLLARSQTHFDLSLGIGEANYDLGVVQNQDAIDIQEDLFTRIDALDHDFGPLIARPEAAF